MKIHYFFSEYKWYKNGWNIDEFKEFCIQRRKESISWKLWLIRYHEFLKILEKFYGRNEKGI